MNRSNKTLSIGKTYQQILILTYFRSKLSSEAKTPTQQEHVDCEIWALMRIVHWWKDRPTKCKRTVPCKQRRHEVTQPVAVQTLGINREETRRTKKPRKTSSPALEQSVRQSTEQERVSITKRFHRFLVMSCCSFSICWFFLDFQFQERSNPSTLSENSLQKRTARSVRKVANKEKTETKKRKIQGVCFSVNLLFFLLISMLSLFYRTESAFLREMLQTFQGNVRTGSTFQNPYR